MRRAGGFTYVGLLIALAIAGVALAGAGELWSTQARREREAQLIAIGLEFQRALERYYAASPGRSVPPRRLQELVEDQRFPTPRRHLRRIYVDPMTGRAEWGLVLEGDRIVGVHSLSEEAPLARLPGFTAAEGAERRVSYRDWVFRMGAGDPRVPN